MQKLNLKQSLSQKLSPQQIQFIKLLQIPTAELNARVEEELEVNPALEEGTPEEEEKKEAEVAEKEETEVEDPLDDISIDEYLSNDDVSGYKMQGDGNFSEDDDKERPIAMIDSLFDTLVSQLGYIQLNERDYSIGKQLIGSIDEDGYIRRDMRAIVNDMAFGQNIETNIIEVEEVLKKIQRFDPPGIGARDLQECLLLQLQRKDQSSKSIQYASKIIALSFEEFKKKHFKKIQKKLGINEEELKEAMASIIHLNPKPGGYSSTYSRNQYIIPDFIIKHEYGKLDIFLNSKNAPELRVNRSYSDMLDTYHKSNKEEKKNKKTRQTITFVKQKLDTAKWFIDAIKQRQRTLLKTMRAILRYQYEFFLDGDESKLKPMILKDIAQEIGMDISTVSRVANSKAVQTDFGIFMLKFFFSESISTDSGEEVSSKEVKHVLKEIIQKESKKKPLSDDKLEKMLRTRGYQIARRTVAKYREQMNIPVARLRKEL
jgi:RNA polymerase sigma-54 factor